MLPRIAERFVKMVPVWRYLVDRKELRRMEMTEDGTQALDAETQHTEMDAAPSEGAGTKRVVIVTPASLMRSAPPIAWTRASSVQRALASWWRPVSTNVILLRKPPS